MKLIRISVRRRRLNALFFDAPPDIAGEYGDDGGLLIDRSVFEESGIKEGEVLSAADIERLVCDSRFARAKNKALYLLSARDYTVKGLTEKLRRDYGEEASNNVALRMAELGFIDDVRFAERYADQLLNVKNMPVRQAVLKLMEKGVDRKTAENAAENFEPDVSRQLDELIAKKYAYKLSGGDRNEINKAVNALARKGFAFSDIRSAISRFCAAELYECED